ncbi:DNA-binding protein [Mycetocola reblochoni]|uniref:Helix-turn-helix domain-containing protein n=2 Tax=Mycetocola reblochoni TaxID=331618 RepID=A0A1R4IY69_9MICO|nr:DNA-binding protein [Mycetocola reblochoni]RLP70897.1 DNA-binding protein [Mycetocola reblochoni]SJN24644.1 hypothetical protein FM119_04385 [Mycetocola reblochoni REB411]
MSGPVLNHRKAAEYCGLAPQTLENLNHLGKGPKRFKNGSRNAYYPADLDAWLEERLVRVEQVSA